MGKYFTKYRQTTVTCRLSLQLESAIFTNLTGRCELNNLCSNRELLIELFCKHHMY